MLSELRWKDMLRNSHLRQLEAVEGTQGTQKRAPILFVAGLTGLELLAEPS